VTVTVYLVHNFKFYPALGMYRPGRRLGPAEYILFKFLKYQYVLSTMCHDDVLQYVTVPGPPRHRGTGIPVVLACQADSEPEYFWFKFIKWYVPVTVCTEYIRVSEVPVGGPSPYRDITYDHDVQLEYD
jgi:hypothetical protein